MHTTINPQLGFLGRLIPSAPANDLLQTLDTALDWKSIERTLHRMSPPTTGQLPCTPLVLFKMSVLQHCYGLSNPQCKKLVGDWLSWRRFVGLGLPDAVPDETTLVNFRKRLHPYGQPENLLALINRQLQAMGLILKTCARVDDTLPQAAPPSGQGRQNRR